MMRCAYLCLDPKSSIEVSFNGAAIFISLSLSLQLQSQHIIHFYIWVFLCCFDQQGGKIEIFNKEHIDTVTRSAQQCKSSSIYIARLFGEIFFHRFFLVFNRGKHFIVLLVYLSLPLTLLLILPNTHLHLHNYVSTTTISLHNRWIIGFCPCITH